MLTMTGSGRPGTREGCALGGLARAGYPVAALCQRSAAAPATRMQSVVRDLLDAAHPPGGTLPAMDDAGDLSPRDAWRDAAQAAELAERLSRAAVEASADPGEDHRLPDAEVAYWASRVAAAAATAAHEALVASTGLGDAEA
jgi:hypothetical protein